jgi:hypothetical protein
MRFDVCILPSQPQDQASPTHKRQRRNNAAAVDVTRSNIPHPIDLTQDDSPTTEDMTQTLRRHPNQLQGEESPKTKRKRGGRRVNKYRESVKEDGHAGVGDVLAEIDREGDETWIREQVQQSSLLGHISGIHAESKGTDGVMIASTSEKKGSSNQPRQLQHLHQSCSDCPRPSQPLIGLSVVRASSLFRLTPCRQAITYRSLSQSHTTSAPWAKLATLFHIMILATPTRIKTTTFLTGDDTLKSASTNYHAPTLNLSCYRPASYSCSKNTTAFVKLSGSTDPTIHDFTTPRYRYNVMHFRSTLHTRHKACRISNNSTQAFLSRTRWGRK